MWNRYRLPDFMQRNVDSCRLDLTPSSSDFAQRWTKTLGWILDSFFASLLDIATPRYVIPDTLTLHKAARILASSLVTLTPLSRLGSPHRTLLVSAPYCTGP